MLSIMALRSLLLTTLLLTTVSMTATAEEIHRDQMEALMATCQADRQLNIEPLRQEAIENCIDGGRGDREYCERFNRNYGERVANQPRGMFWHLPSCEKAVAAERYFRMNPARDTFTYQ